VNTNFLSVLVFDNEIVLKYTDYEAYGFCSDLIFGRESHKLIAGPVKLKLKLPVVVSYTVTFVSIRLR